MHIQKITATQSLIKPPLSEKLKSGCVVLQPGQEVEKHVTENREEVLIILEGTATVHCETEVETVYAPSLVYIPKNKKHNVINESDSPLKYLYIVTRIN
ncbi:MAG: hypothetical protein UV59_C0031G0015 [Candidatus Gottesmanbacteria bacterium GW2011_GWA1_43_11]|uniref:Cupin type-2 domain-containing protein n=1 Tax=Candidatus Gottesmanbacteria bacterium GW2011_GWA1_43_11 TaxID=1618436 RepID=A0A0G1FAE7_9BACT|nr:MAG: hypothetical protein UV59_C0031G0015 [Candidatus Gottesmanbacteria bacterium GW2011_GWA1_43_11]